MLAPLRKQPSPPIFARITNLSITRTHSRFILPTDALWQGVVYGLEPSFVVNAGSGEFLAEGSPFFASGPPPIALVAWSVIWIVIVLNLAVVLLRRREL